MFYTATRLYEAKLFMVNLNQNWIN